MTHPLQELSDAQRLELAQLCDRVGELLGGGRVFLIYRSLDETFTTLTMSAAGRPDLIEALEAIGGGLCSVAMSLGNTTLRSWGEDIGRIVRSVRARERARKKDLQ